MTHTITVHTSPAYNVLCGSGLLPAAGTYCRRVNRGVHALIVTDSHVGPLYADTVERSLTQAGYEVRTFTFRAGEQSKRMATGEEIYEQAAKCPLHRDDLIVALGGGVTGDMAGFAAATWLRGIDVVQIPTSLLAQVDSSIGGKTGVDTVAGKNLVGAFWQPRLVISDPDTLDTLPDAVRTEGAAEAIKTALIADEALFAQMERAGAITPAMIRRCIAVKRDVVERDEREAGARKLLNFGHTIGHALERRYAYRLPHGLAVAVGMVAAARIGRRMGVTPADVEPRIAAVLRRFGLPTEDPVPPEQLLTFLTADKKNHASGVDFVLLTKVGSAVWQTVEPAQLVAWLTPEAD